MAELEEIVEQAEVVEKVVRSLTQIKIAYAGIGAACGAAAGAIIAFQIAYKKAEAKYEAISQAEISEMRQHYAAKTEATMGRITKPDLERVVNDLGYNTRDDEEEIVPEGALKLLETPEVIKESPAPVVKTQNVFEEHRSTDVWDYAIEVRGRSADIPYVIHADEFTNSEGEYQQTTLTYYEDDDVLADQRDTVIDDPDELINLANLMKFGHGSNDPNIVYIRNDRIDMDFEICRSTGSYAKEVHGFEHSDVPRRGRREWDG